MDLFRDAWQCGALASVSAVTRADRGDFPPPMLAQAALRHVEEQREGAGR